jgi:hypothetical protein
MKIRKTNSFGQLKIAKILFLNTVLKMKSYLGCFVVVLEIIFWRNDYDFF